MNSIAIDRRQKEQQAPGKEFHYTLAEVVTRVIAIVVVTVLVTWAWPTSASTTAADRLNAAAADREASSLKALQRQAELQQSSTSATSVPCVPAATPVADATATGATGAVSTAPPWAFFEGQISSQLPLFVCSLLSFFTSRSQSPLASRGSRSSHIVLSVDVSLGPQHNVRYPGRFHDFQPPLCHYSSRDVPTANHQQLLDCMERYRTSYRTNPKQSQALPCNQRRKVYDIWKYNDEAKMLEVRLEENWDVVDYFVIIESTTAFSGLKKELAFAENSAKYAKYMEKIIHVTCDMSVAVVPNDGDGNPGRGWPREYLGSDCLKFGLAGASPDDIVVFGDTDEIARPEVLSAAQMCSSEMGALTPSDPSQYRIMRLSGPRFMGSWKWSASANTTRAGSVESERRAACDSKA